MKKKIDEIPRFQSGGKVSNNASSSILELIKKYGREAVLAAAMSAGVISGNVVMPSMPTPGRTSNQTNVVQKFARGGQLNGFGGGDTVPALLEKGEYVIVNEHSTRSNQQLFNAINIRKIQRPGKSSKVSSKHQIYPTPFPSGHGPSCKKHHRFRTIQIAI